jgi:8-oxo-dGTP pyrophosphatase MutT (NUDIX family)
MAAKNSRWQVYHDHLIDDHGNEVKDYLVLAGCHPRIDHLTGVCVLPVLGDKLVLVRAYRHPLGREFWEAPRGFIDEDEAPAEAALRELTEETGLHCAPSDFAPLGSYAPEPGTMAARGALFAATRCEGTLRASRDELGLGTAAMFGRNELAALIDAGEIADAGTLIVYYRFCERYR